MKPAPPVIKIRFPSSGIRASLVALTIVSFVLAVPLLAVMLALAGVFGCSSSEQKTAAAESATAELRISVWPAGSRAGRSFRWTLRCGPAGGTLPRPQRACRRLLGLRRPFAPVPRGTACTQIYGGPQTARVRGRLRGKRVSASFSRTDGCQISRWDRVRFLFPK
jgi:hypothetical protein